MLLRYLRIGVNKKAFTSTYVNKSKSTKGICLVIDMPLANNCKKLISYK